MIYICKLQSHVIDCQSSNQLKEGKKIYTGGCGWIRPVGLCSQNTKYFGRLNIKTGISVQLKSSGQWCLLLLTFLIVSL